MEFLRNQEVVRRYVISTSKQPPSNVENSLGTPRGLHAIAERIGAGEPLGRVFQARQPTGRIFCEADAGGHDENALVTTRILWLRGLEAGVNQGERDGVCVDTFKRYVYIHGTNREHLIGQPQSAGCVVMRNSDIIELYEALRVGDLVLIGD